MIKPKKNLKHSMDKPAKAKNWHGTESFPDLYTGEQIHRTEDQIKAIAQDALLYCMKEPRCLKISQFIRDKRLKQSTYTYWKQKYPWFMENHLECLAILGDKREIGASFKELDREMQLKVMHLYDPEWKTVNEYHSRLKEDQQTANADVIKEVLKDVLRPFEEPKK